MGGGTFAGTYGAHESKLSMLGSQMNAEIGLFAYLAGEQLARRLVRANGLDPDTATPTLVPSPIMRTDVLTAVDAISKLNLAMLPPNHPARKAVFEGVDLPWEDEEASLMLPRPPMFPPREQAADPAAGTPAKDPAADDKTTPAEDPGEKPTEAV
jgi:hypothetical protein